MPPFSRRGSRTCYWGKAWLLGKQRNARATNAACFGFGLNPNKAPTCALARRSASRAQLSGGESRRSISACPSDQIRFGQHGPLSDCHVSEPICRSAYQAKAQGRDQNEAIGTSVKDVHQRAWPEDSANQIFKSILDAYEGKTPCRSRSWSRKGCPFICSRVFLLLNVCAKIASIENVGAAHTGSGAVHSRTCVPFVDR